MRIKLGRPDLGAYADRFDVPPATADFGVTFLGVSSLLFDDGDTAVLTDGFFSRPSLLRVALGRLAPDDTRINSALTRLELDRDDGGRRLAAVLPVHTHFDHAMDSATVALRTGAVLAGGRSAANVGRGAGLPDDRIHVVTPHEPMPLGAFTLTFVESGHCPPDRFPGTITAPVVPPARASAYRCGEAWSVLVEHASGRTALVQGSAGYRPGTLAGRRADVVYLGVGQLGVRDEDYIRTYWAETVRAVGARRVVLVHWDDFFRPLDRPLRALPFAGDDLDVTMRVLARLADQDGVALHLPTLWRREDPWAGLR
ncbi:MBL fold metallo-hydrolase [Micromonospora sp. NPDC047074]|uniref:MBL fold metallo-hydrolase n=1 Tax=Micromonospora sp. NPDC047074 TaxID=3154339 RepID=UPI0033F99061